MNWLGGEEMRLLLVEDHALLTQTMGAALRAEGFDVESPPELSADAVLAHADAVRPDVVLLDLELGSGVSGVPVIRPLCEQGFEVVVVTGSGDRRVLGECLEAGASGIFLKSRPFAELVDAIMIAMGHGPVTPAAARQQLLRELREGRAADQATAEPFERLTPRERDVLQLLADGMSAEKIAAELFVSLSTVRSQVRAILMKLGVNSQLEAVAMARRAGWSRS
jgi:DNA-binding NarL/FixJ family response regulator